MTAKQSDTKASKEPEWALAYDHAWRYFSLHATQRMTVFNFFVVLSGFVVAGIATTMQGSRAFSSLGCVLGLILVMLAFVFWKLDQRAAFLIKHSEAIQKLAEEHLLPFDARLFCLEESTRELAKSRKPFLFAPWTYGFSFRLVFTAMAIIGVGSAVLCGLTAIGIISWQVKDDKTPEVAIALKPSPSHKPGITNLLPQSRPNVPKHP